MVEEACSLGQGGPFCRFQRETEPAATPTDATHDAFSAVLEWVFTLRDAKSIIELTSKIPPLGSMSNFDADVIKTTTRHQCENRLTHAV